MNSIKQLLETADPLRSEPALTDEARAARRQAVFQAASSNKNRAVSRRFPLARLTVAAVLMMGIVFLGWRAWPRMAMESYAAVRFEVRLAEDHPGPGLREAMIDGRVIYLHEEVVVSNGDIARAEVVPGNNTGDFWVNVEFSESGAIKVRQATESHIGRPMAIIVDDEVVVAPLVRSAIGPAAVISGNYTRDQAERIVHGIEAN